MQHALGVIMQTVPLMVSGFYGLLAEGVRSCSNALQGFYNSSKQLFDLDAGNWQESETDTILCKAGLW
jgi:hypothetical protein